VHEVDPSVRGADSNLQQRMRREKLGQARNDDVARDPAGHVDAKPSRQATRGRMKHHFQLFGLGQQFLAAIEKDFAVGSQTHAACGALQQPGANARLELLDGSRHAPLGQSQLFGCAAEARQLGDVAKIRRFRVAWALFALFIPGNSVALLSTLFFPGNS
jgi:hypothetical protein